MKILWIKSEELLPLDTGHRKRSYNLIKHLSEASQITYLAYSHQEQPNEELTNSNLVKAEVSLTRAPAYKRGANFYLKVLTQVGSSMPYFVKRNISTWIKKQQRQLFGEEQVELILCDCLDMSATIDYSLPVPKILLTNGVATELWQQRYETARGLLRRAYFNYETKRMAAFESDVCNRFDLILVASETERQKLIDSYRVRVPIKVVPTGVDCEYFAANNLIDTVPRRLVFTGNNDLLSNIDGLLWFAAEVYPIIRRAYPDVTFDIIGPRPASEIVALGHKDESIRVTGFVDDIRPYLAAAELFVVPLRATGGMRAKIFEAMAMKLPVVSTVEGAEGLGLVNDLHLTITDNARAMAAAVIDSFANQERATNLAEQAYRLVHSQHDWSTVARLTQTYLTEATRT